jgi:prevent-host-death family protein
MKRVTATEAARKFADVLDAVEARGESFLVVRHGRAVAQIGPAGGGEGAAVKKVLRAAPRDRGWVEDMTRMRAALQVEERRWSA